MSAPPHLFSTLTQPCAPTPVITHAMLRAQIAPQIHPFAPLMDTLLTLAPATAPHT